MSGLEIKAYAESTDHIDASRKYFSEQFPDEVASESYGGMINLDEARYVIGVTATKEFSIAAIAADIYSNDDDPYMVFPDFSGPRLLFESGLASALGQITENMKEEDEDFSSAGVRLVAEGWQLDRNDTNDYQIMNDVNDNAYPIGVDMSRPVYAQEFLDISTYEGVGVASFYTDDSIDGAPTTWNLVAQVGPDEPEEFIKRGGLNDAV